MYFYVVEILKEKHLNIFIVVLEDDPMLHFEMCLLITNCFVWKFLFSLCFFSLQFSSGHLHLFSRWQSFSKSTSCWLHFRIFLEHLVIVNGENHCSGKRLSGVINSFRHEHLTSWCLSVLLNWVNVLDH